ncbi:MAG: hypothetical protein JWM32_2965 [Verrucomicrobia bacterium]|nr:hypothetical protein [Verrucomicrobiota bacterium]
MPDRITSRWPRLGAWLVLLVPIALNPVRAQSDAAGASTSSWDISNLLDRLPSFSPFGEPDLTGSLPIRYYARPHFGDFLHRDYLRLPVGARAKVNEHFELNTEVEGYFTHGLKDSAGYGLSMVRFGGKYEQVMAPLHPLGWSTGVDLETPVSRPPLELTDGHRHVRPYFAVSEKLIPDCNLVGYASIGADFVSHTELPPNFGRNQLHANALTFSTGATRDWKRFRVALTGTWSTSMLLSDENHNVFALRPDILIPLTKKPGPGARTHLLLTLGGRFVNGPDGTETGLNGSLRIEFAVQPGKK